MEYVSRRLLLIPNIPCSLLTEGKSGNILVAVHPLDDPTLFFKKIWYLDQIADGEIMPHCEESQNSIELLCDSITSLLPIGNLPITYAEHCPSIADNIHSEPVNQEIYNSIFNNVLNTCRHQNKREDWLWALFLKAFSVRMGSDGDKFCNMKATLPAIAIYQRERVQHRHRCIFQYWLIWKQHMLDFSTTISPELAIWLKISAFSSSSLSSWGDLE